MVTIESIEPVTGSSWEINWSSDLDDPTFYVYVDGALISVTEETSYVINVTDGSPIIDILDTDDPPKVYPRRFVLTWYAASGAGTYRVEEQIGSDWIVRRTITDDGAGYFRFISRAVEDSQTHAFRVTAIGTNGNLGTVAALSSLMVRIPDPPALTMSYSSSTGKATFAAA